MVLQASRLRKTLATVNIRTHKRALLGMRPFVGDQSLRYSKTLRTAGIITSMRLWTVCLMLNPDVPLKNILLPKCPTAMMTLIRPRNKCMSAVVLTKLLRSVEH